MDISKSLGIKDETQFTASSLHEDGHSIWILLQLILFMLKFYDIIIFFKKLLLMNMTYDFLRLAFATIFYSILDFIA